MQELEDRIRHDGIVKAGNVLKVDAFLNHQCDVELFDHMGAEWARLFKDVEINKILTIEASGIGMACIAAQHFGGVPVVFAKKAQSINLDGEQYATTIYSFTKQKEYPVIVGKRFLSEGDKVLIIDDFLANGCALEGLIKICEAAGAEVSGIGIAVEKGFQGGGDKLRERGFRVESLARIADMDCETGEMLRYFYDDNGPLRNPRGEPVPCTRYYDRAGQEVYYYAPLLNWDADTYEVLSADFYYPDGTLDYRVENDEDNWWNETYYDASGYVRVGSYCDAEGNLVGYVSYNADGSVSRYVILG